MTHFKNKIKGRGRNKGKGTNKSKGKGSTAAGSTATGSTAAGRTAIGSTNTDRVAPAVTAGSSNSAMGRLVPCGSVAATVSQKGKERNKGSVVLPLVPHGSVAIAVGGLASTPPWLSQLMAARRSRPSPADLLEAERLRCDLLPGCRPQPKTSAFCHWCRAAASPPRWQLGCHS